MDLNPTAPGGAPHPNDERPHRPSGTPAWFENYVVECATEDGSLGLRMELRVRPDQARSQFSMLLLRRDQPTVWIDESEAPLPRPGLEVRASGLWMEFIAQVPWEHFTADLEAFAIELEDPADARGDGFGHRVPVACELEWQTKGPVVPLPQGYKIPCFVMGEFQLGQLDLELDCWGWRQHTWGEVHELDRFRFRHHDGQWPTDEEPLGIVVGWGCGLDGEEHRLIETESGIAWRSVREGA